MAKYSIYPNKAFCQEEIKNKSECKNKQFSYNRTDDKHYCVVCLGQKEACFNNQ